MSQSQGGLPDAAKSCKFQAKCHMYKGVTYSNEHPVSSLKKIEEDLELNSQDIVVASFPKSGRSRYLSLCVINFIEETHVNTYKIHLTSFHDIETSLVVRIHSQWRQEHPILHGQ